MKKLIIILVVFLFGFILVGWLPSKEIDYDYLRIHIKANSNLGVDQDVKLDIKNIVVGEFSSRICISGSKQEVVDIVKSCAQNLEKKCEDFLKSKGLNYDAKINIVNEFFPSRVYDNTVLESGYYDAVVVELGQAVGDNWWCVMYPPLCFVNKNENITQINFKSIIGEWWNKFFAN